MRIQNLILGLFVAMFAMAASTERASAQCWSCKLDGCMWGDGPGCVMTFPSTDGFGNCIDSEDCDICYTEDEGNCLATQDEDPNVAAAKMEAELSETVVAIKAGESVPAEGSFVYVSRGPDLVVRRRCDMAEVARVAIAEVQPARILAGG